jgi:hypothetical protein
VGILGADPSGEVRETPGGRLRGAVDWTCAPGAAWRRWREVAATEEVDAEAARARKAKAMAERAILLLLLLLLLLLSLK